MRGRARCVRAARGATTRRNRAAIRRDVMAHRAGRRRVSVRHRDAACVARRLPARHGRHRQVACRGPQGPSSIGDRRRRREAGAKDEGRKRRRQPVRSDRLARDLGRAAARRPKAHARRHQGSVAEHRALSPSVGRPIHRLVLVRTVARSHGGLRRRTRARRQDAAHGGADALGLRRSRQSVRRTWPRSCGHTNAAASTSSRILDTMRSAVS
jgi:hypothetical protein